MSGMTIFITIVHVLLAVFMIFVILLQPGKDAGMGAAFGGGAATSAFGGRGAVTFLSKVTAACATLFFLTSLALSFVGMSPSVANRITAKQSTTTPPPATKTVEQQQPGTPAAEGSAPATPEANKATTTPPTPLSVPPEKPAQQLKTDEAPPAPVHEAAPNPTAPPPTK